MEKFIKVKDETSHFTHLEVSFYYDLGGMNYFTGRENKRGYYLSVIPVSKSQTVTGFTSISSTLFDGIKKCLKAVDRKSKKSETEAKALAKEALNELVTYVCSEKNISVDEDISEFAF